MKIVFSDFDGTLTHKAKLGAVFFKVMELIEANHSELIVVSGRSVSWGHFLLTHFPLKHVIMEGGGVIISKSMEGVLSQEFLVNESTLDYLEEVTKELLIEVPETVMSLDSLGRLSDRAIEFSQMKHVDVKRAEEFLKSKKEISFSRSNVHINYWAGDISKANGVEYFLKNYSPHIPESDCIFYGDALNDESMFRYFSNTVGVSNIISVIDSLKYKPSIVLEGKDNVGIYGVYNHLRQLFNEDF